MATIIRRTSQDGSLTYLVRVRRKGAPPQTATFTKLTDAKKWIQITEGAILDGRHFTTSEAKRHMVSELLTRYRTDVLPHKRPSTVYNQVYHLQWWNDQLGHYVLSDITPARIIECRNALAHTRGSATVRRYLAVLSHAFTVAVEEWQWMPDNPVLKINKPKEPRGRVRFLTDDERQRLLTSCKVSRNPYLYPVVVLALATGARKMELLSLTWRQVDLQRGTVTLQDTKNGERRTLYLTGLALDLTRAHAKIRRIDSLLVFPGPSGTQPASVREAWEYALRRANIPDFHFHDLRHTAASYLAMNGASLLEIAEILGHKTLSMVKRYAHLSDSHTRHVVERMNRAVFGE